MRILYVSKETPLQPAGGIATYLEYMVPALRDAGHEVFLFSWTEGKQLFQPSNPGPFLPRNVHIEKVDFHQAWLAYPTESHNLCISHWLADKIISKVQEWEIDVVEATDYLAPALTLFQRLQTRPGSEQVLFVTYNHGLLEVISEADQIKYNSRSRLDYACERQQCRISDLVISPSHHARDRLLSLGINNNIEIVREPYRFKNDLKKSMPTRNEIQYIGRLSIQKGIDKLVYLANLLHPVYPLRRIELVGRIGYTPFRQGDIQEYVKARLNSDLSDKVIFRDYVSRSSIFDIFEPGAVAPHLGTDETFSYACIEAIDAGLVPVVRGGTAMTEFFPPDLQHMILDQKMRSPLQVQRQISEIIEKSEDVSYEVRAFCHETLNPANIAEQIGRTYDAALKRKRGKTIHISQRKHASISDVTVLIPAYKPNHEFMETIDSLSWQSSGIPKVVICDDGTPDSHQHWFDYAHAMIPDCRIVRQPNSGLLAARNTLIQECETELSIFLDTDDILAPELIKNMLDAWNSCPQRPDAIIPQRRNFGESREQVLRHLLHDHLHILENDYRMTALIRTEVLLEIGFDSTRRNGEGDDWAFWLEFTGREYNGLLLPDDGFLYRFRRGSMSWPWSEGQHVGTQTMVHEIVKDMCISNSKNAISLSRALFARNVTE